jgi:hypothetical protein
VLRYQLLVPVVLIVCAVILVVIGISANPLVTATQSATNLVQLLVMFWLSIRRWVKIKSVSHLAKHVPQLVHRVVNRTAAKEHGLTQSVSNEIWQGFLDASKDLRILLHTKLKEGMIR